MQIISMNTDGLFYRCDSDEERRIVREEIEKVAAEIQCPIDFTTIAEHRQEHINSYQQVIVDGDGSREVKGKGAWNPDPGINADHNATVCAKAMAQHLLDGSGIRTFIELAASEKRLLEFTSMQTTRSSTLRVGGEAVGGMIRVYRSTIAEDELPPITIDAAGKSPEKRVARGCAYAPGLDWPDDIDIDWYVDETLRRMDQSSTTFSPENNVFARELEAKGLQLRGTGGGKARTKRSDTGLPANFAGCQSLAVFVGGSSGVIAVSDGEIPLRYGSLVHRSGSFEIHRLDVLAEQDITPKSLRTDGAIVFDKGWFAIEAAAGNEARQYDATFPFPPPGRLSRGAGSGTGIVDEQPAEVRNNDEFLEAMFGLDADEALVLTSKADGKIDFTCGPRNNWPDESYLDPEASNYAAISVCEPEKVGIDANGDPQLVYHRTKATQRAMYLVMLDDIGTKAKDPCEYGFGPPTVKLETSPGNFQYLYKLDQPITNRAAAQQLVTMLVRGFKRDGVHIEITDPGSGDIVRFFRMPFGSNRKPHLDEPFETVIHDMDFSRTYAPDLMAEWVGGRIDWGLKDTADTHARTQQPADEATLAEHPLMHALAAEGLLKGREKDGWHEIICPWVNQHGNGDDSGTKVKIDQAGTWNYFCHHGSCRMGADGRDKHTVYDIFHWLQARGYDVPHPTRGDPFADFDVSRLNFESVIQEQTKDSGASEVAGVDMGFTVSSVDVLSPPGICGEIAREMERGAFRPLPEAYVLYSLQVLALAGMHYMTPMGARFNLLTFLIAQTASGKESANAALARFAKQMGRSGHISNEPRSDKDVQLAALETKGSITFVVDEAQRFFGASSNKSSSASIAAMTDVLMAMVTAEIWLFSPLHKRNLAGVFEPELKRLKSRLSKDDLEIDERGRLESTEAHYEAMLGMLEEGIDRPYVSLAASSTPESLDSVISSGNIDKGLIGRGIVLRASPQRRQKQTSRSDALDYRLVARIQNIVSGPGQRVSLEGDALTRFEAIEAYYEHDDRLNHGTLGGLYARAGQRIIQIASILAVETGEISVEFLDYAQVLFESHLKDVGLMRRVNETNEAPTDEVDAQEAAQIVGEIILDALEKSGGWLYISKVKNIAARRNRWLRQQFNRNKKGRTVFEEVFEHLTAGGLIETEGKKARAAR